MSKELGEREAFSAPIWKLSHDELSIIFNMCAEDDWIAPMHLSGVCRTWRHAALACHRAWTFIDLKDDYSLELLPLFLRRSGRRTFHVGLLRNSSVQIHSAVMQMAGRVQCLSIPKLTSLLNQAAFPALTRLVLCAQFESQPLLELRRSQFPLLHHLDLFCHSVSPLQIPDEAVEPPLIQTFDIRASGALDVLHVVQKFGQCLKDLRLTIGAYVIISSGFPIHLPQLETLLLRDRRTRKDSTTHTMVTPRLKTFVWETAYPTHPFPLDMDLGLLAHLGVYGDQKPPLTALRGLKVLQFHGHYLSYSELLQPLLYDQSICPTLEVIEICDSKLKAVAYSNTEEMILRINESRGGSTIKLFSVAEDQLQPPYMRDHQPCGSAMPCYVNFWD